MMEWALEPKTVSIQGPLGPRRYAPGLSPPCGPRQQQRLPHSLGQEGVVAGVARLRLQLGWEVSKYLLQVPQLSVESPFPPQAMGLPPLHCFTGRLLT